MSGFKIGSLVEYAGYSVKPAIGSVGIVCEIKSPIVTVFYFREKIKIQYLTTSYMNILKLLSE